MVYKIRFGRLAGSIAIKEAEYIGTRNPGGSSRPTGNKGGPAALGGSPPLVQENTWFVVGTAGVECILKLSDSESGFFRFQQFRRPQRFQ